MKFQSTRDHSVQTSLERAIAAGLSPDGGLYVPDSFPKVNSALTSMAELGERVLAPYFEHEASILNQICGEAFNFQAPLRAIDSSFWALELFHGPTAAFKDFGARFLARYFKLQKQNAIILVATSGDTGGAVASAFDGLPGLDVVVLFPENGVSKRQRHQLTCWGENIHSFAVKGTFDDCQALAKESFKTWSGERLLSSANSISLGRLLPQIVYYAHASLNYFTETKRKPHFIIPTGNLGNAMACLWAYEMGFPIGKVTLATNSNDAIPEFFKTGQWTPKTSVRTLANAMDVGSPSNVERLFDLYKDPREAPIKIDSYSVNDAAIRETIQTAYKKWNWIICPHTATAVHYYLKYSPADAVVVATAHPAKFETIIEPLIGRAVELPQSLLSIGGRREKFSLIDATLDELTKRLKTIDMKK